VSADVPFSPEVLWSRYAASRSEEDRNRLVVHYAPLVKYVGGRFAATLPSHVDLDDLLSDGTIGLVTAVERFDPTRSVDFAAFAISRIRGAMIDGLRSLDWLPRLIRAQVAELETCTQRLYAALGRPPTTAELSVELGITTEEVAARRRHQDDARQVPLPPAEFIDERRPAERRYEVVDPTQLSPELVRELRSMPERHQVLVALYYFERLTMAEIGTVLGVTESRVSQLHQQIRRQLRDRISATGQDPSASRRDTERAPTPGCSHVSRTA
jgi:RNA polymerase sigma factor for flagellar operon FliA